jgi:hypothetical protein
VKWFYINNHHLELPKPSGCQPKHALWWNMEPTMQEGIQLPPLLKKIKALLEARLRAEHVAVYQYTDDEDTSRMPDKETDDDVIIERPGRIFKDMRLYTLCPMPEYSATRPPNQVSSRG